MKKREAKPKVERCMQEKYDRGGAERGQHNKQGSMEEYNHQLHGRPQMTGQARDDEEEELFIGSRGCSFEWSVECLMKKVAKLF